MNGHTYRGCCPRTKKGSRCGATEAHALRNSSSRSRARASLVSPIVGFHCAQKTCANNTENEIHVSFGHDAYRVQVPVPLGMVSSRPGRYFHVFLFFNILAPKINLQEHTLQYRQGHTHARHKFVVFCRTTSSWKTPKHNRCQP